MHFLPDGKRARVHETGAFLKIDLIRDRESQIAGLCLPCGEVEIPLIGPHRERTVNVLTGRAGAEVENALPGPCMNVNASAIPGYPSFDCHVGENGDEAIGEINVAAYAVHPGLAALECHGSAHESAGVAPLNFPPVRPTDRVASIVGKAVAMFQSG